jgi:hypothetical protein
MSRIKNNKANWCVILAPFCCGIYSCASHHMHNSPRQFFDVQ